VAHLTIKTETVADSHAPVAIVLPVRATWLYDN
jgi:hypothetical protein